MRGPCAISAYLHSMVGRRARTGTRTFMVRVSRGGFGGVKVHYSGTPNIQKHFYKKDHGQKVASERMEEGV